jgi:hypothetical protein
MRHVITLSSIPPRFPQIAQTLRCLLAQTSRPEAVELYIPRSYRRFPQWGGGLPDVPEGVTIVRVDADLGPATKVLPAARARRGQAVDILFGDDDAFYPPDWAARFMAVRKEHPEAAVCAAASSVARIGRPWSASGPAPRAELAVPPDQQPGLAFRLLVQRVRAGLGRPAEIGTTFRKLERSGYVDIFEGYGGVALRPDFLDEMATVIPPVLWSVDDVWLSGQLARRGIPIWGDVRLNLVRKFLRVSQSYDLFSSVIDGADRDAANLACVDHMRRAYGIWGGDAIQSA